MSYPYPLHRGESFRPFFIVGSGRSGNTLLRRLLQASPEIHIPPETYVLGKVIRCYQRYRFLMSWDNLVNFTLSHFEFYKEFDTFEISLRALAEELKKIPPASRSLARILDSFYRFHAAQVGKPCSVWGDKTPNNSYSLDRIFSVFPQGQFIHILRDGGDVIPSLLEAKIRPDLESAARRWKTSVNAVQKFMRAHPANCLEIRYENLVQSPEATMKPVFEFLRLSFDAEFLKSQAPASSMRDLSKYTHLSNVLSPISTDSIGKGRKKLTPEEKAVAQKIIGEDLNRLGYEPLV